jgi:hypothetical protein
MTVLDPGLLRTYLETDYITATPQVGPITLRPGIVSASLEELFRKLRKMDPPHSAALITASDPFDLPLPPRMNEARHGDLLAILDYGWETYFESAVVRDDQMNGIELEKSVLVIGIDRRKAMDIGRLFQQNFIVFAERGQPVELLTLR